MLENNA